MVRAHHVQLQLIAPAPHYPTMNKRIPPSPAMVLGKCAGYKKVEVHAEIFSAEGSNKKNIGKIAEDLPHNIYL